MEFRRQQDNSFRNSDGQLPSAWPSFVQRDIPELGFVSTADLQYWFEPGHADRLQRNAIIDTKIVQAESFLKQYARDFIIGAGVPTNAQRNSALDAAIVLSLAQRRY